jgi:mannose-6-phosphate isomerase-like protein (cupin superfamily)
MPHLLNAPIQIPVPGGKVIDEYVGGVATASSHMSVAKMIAPAGWEEPFQTPDFEEVTVVLRGTVLVECDGEIFEVHAGQSIVTAKGECVRYSVGSEGAEYVAICTPAFSPELVNREE